MTPNSQLWKKTDARCRLVERITADKVITSPSPGVPVMFWPNGEVCWPATMYMTNEASRRKREKHKKGSRNSRSDSITTKASLLSHLLRLAHPKGGFANLYDSDIKNWILDLRLEKKDGASNTPKRNERHIRKIVHAGLKFLLWYQQHFLPNNSLIGHEVHKQIKIETNKGSSPNGQYQYEYITHRDLGQAEASRKVQAIGSHHITELYGAIRKLTKDRFLVKRGETILRLLEATGGRRVEVCDLTIDDIIRAKKTGYIKLESAKSNDSERTIPIAQEWLNPIIVFINGPRKKLVKKLIAKGKLERDTAHLLLSSSSGRKISEETITKFISNLRIKAGISEKACGHMFRHRFITIQVATRLKGYERDGLPMDVANTILTKVATLSGHSQPTSLYHYIDLAFDELGMWETSEKVLSMRSQMEGAYRTLEQIKNDMKSDLITNNEATDRIFEVLDLLLEAQTN